MKPQLICFQQVISDTHMSAFSDNWMERNHAYNFQTFMLSQVFILLLMLVVK